MQAWTYRFEICNVDDDDAGVHRLNILGSQGWECFHVEEFAIGLRRKSFRFWLKRASRPVDPRRAELA